MTQTVQLVIIGLIAYALGNINPAILIGKAKGIDIRKEGSCNAGTTNAIRVLGTEAGIATFLLDILKGFIAVRIGYNYCGAIGAEIAFALVVLGHCFPALYKFKGGKGVACTFGAGLAMCWTATFAAFLLFLIAFLICRKASVCSLIAAVTYPFLTWFYEPRYMYFTIGVSVFLIIMHIPNIKRISKGEEKKLEFGKGTLKQMAEEEEKAGKDSPAEMIRDVEAIAENTEAAVKKTAEKTAGKAASKKKSTGNSTTRKSSSGKSQSTKKSTAKATSGTSSAKKPASRKTGNSANSATGKSTKAGKTTKTTKTTKSTKTTSKKEE